VKEGYFEQRFQNAEGRTLELEIQEGETVSRVKEQVCAKFGLNSDGLLMWLGEATIEDTDEFDGWKNPEDVFVIKPP